ncbi:MAG: Rrf2 family transcriptional regulator [Planctomycetes bacterium]|nr:Rrf2 family transcriptional regulator [Planctomycetota bacterium]
MAVITRETDYALRALIRLAQGPGAIPVRALAEREDAPEPFLRKIMQRLHRAGIVKSYRGPFGGYALAVPSSDITLLRLLETVQQPLVMNECFVKPEMCHRVKFCPVRRRLAELQEDLNTELDDIRLSDLVKDQHDGGATS